MAPCRVARCSCPRALSWLPVLFVVLVVAWSYYAYVFELCLYTIPSVEEQSICLVTFHLCFAMFMWSYWRTIFTKPGNPAKEFSLTKADREQYEKEQRPEAQQEILKKVARELPVYTCTDTGAIRYCDRCRLIKPDRCHHCSTCNTCVLKMDHHCPWVNNCVGFSNYKFFILFLAYSVLYCLFITATVLRYFIKFWTRPSGPPCSTADPIRMAFQWALPRTSPRCLGTRRCSGCFLSPPVWEMDTPSPLAWSLSESQNRLLGNDVPFADEQLDGAAPQTDGSHTVTVSMESES
ncbi:palmitoyltransferase ZDHHC2-like isoform X7 [Scleropages formosus]|uniref:palmitoyltransferase ZDHHC2-like isoform X7 n=1 Tax=Scleropages formosus TaxID=113540 RepID=UPI0010FA9C11|nr:palmitoyltransferase ZDHHC2-like isoform X7 [Scleropages formosus]